MRKFKNHYYWCRYTKSDLWGNILFSHKRLKIFFSLYKLRKIRHYKQFVFKVNYKKARPKRRRLTPFSRARLDRFKLFAYYLISGSFLKFVVQKIMRSGPYMMKNLIKIFDCQLYMILWRNRFYLTPFFSKRAIEAGFIEINGKTEYCSSRILQLGDVISFTVKPLLHLRLLWMMRYLKPRESFHMLNLKTITFIFLRYPKFKSIIRYFKMPQGAYMTNFQWF